MTNSPKLTIRVDMTPSFGTGLHFVLDHEDVNDILQANGYSTIEYESVGPCGLTDYYRDEWGVTGPDGARTDARRALNGILKRRMKTLLTAS